MIRSRSLLLVVLVVFGAAACSVQSEDTAVAIDNEALPDELRPSTPPPTTTTPVTGEEATIYFIDGENGTVAPVARSVDDSTLESALEALFTSPSTDAEREDNLTNLLVLDAENEEANPLNLVSAEFLPVRNRWVVRLRGNIQGEGDDRLKAFAQIVFTATDRSYSVSDSVELRTARNEPIEVTTDSTTVAGPVSRRDFASLDPGNLES